MPVRASRQDGSYPRPRLCREQWLSLDGDWDFAFDDADSGVTRRWFEAGSGTGPRREHGRVAPFDRRIRVPFPPESAASGIGERGFHPVVWYRRRISHDALVGALHDAADGGAAERRHEPSRVLLHFGAVDFETQVWVDGHLVCSHTGGQTPFTADVTEALQPSAEQHVLIVRAQDHPGDVEQPRGKQDWRENPHGIWYERTTGIWQSVWAEVVPADHVLDAVWTTDLPAAAVHGQLTLARPPRRALLLEVGVRLDDELLAEHWVAVQGATTDIDISIPALRNGQDRARLLWSPEHPVLLDVSILLRDRASGEVVDTVASYLGLRTVSIGAGSFQLNEQPYYLRSVLNQGYRRDTHLAAAGTDQLRSEVGLAKQIGFNAVRMHQKAEDPRFLYWADRLGLLVWAETAAAYAFSARAVTLLVTEWMELVLRDRSHPCVVTWVPINESWGVQDIASSQPQRSYSRALAELTRALDPTRPVVSNEGWEHLDSDIFGIHDYSIDPEDLRERYTNRVEVDALRTSAYGPAGRRLALTSQQAAARDDTPLMITEFGGVSMFDEDDAWGYAITGSDSEYATRLQQLFDAVRASKDVAGFCYTQFMDTGQETNGLLFADGTPKLPLETLRHIVTGVKNDQRQASESTFGWRE